MIDKIIRLIKVERVDDIPVLLAQVQKMQVPALLDQFLPTHGHWKGELSFGEVVAVQRIRPYAPGLVWYEGLRVASTHRPG